MDRPGLTADLAVLRTLVVAVDLGGFGRAAAALDRSPSAVSLQLRGLEAQLGQRLFRKDGRGVALTEMGDLVVSYARRMLDLNDEMLTAVRGHAVQGELRFGLPHDLANGALPAALARYARAHPGVHVQVRVAGNRALLDMMERGELEMALTFAREGGADALATLPMIWIGGPDAAPSAGEPLPLVLLDPPCVFRHAATTALDAAGRTWRLAASSDSVTGLYATVEAGLGITVRTQMGLPATLRAIEGTGLPSLPTIDLCLRYTPGTPSPAATRLAELLRQSVREQIAAHTRAA